ncbi:MAG: sulfite exporter TauE/SafE family protein [Candidatus Omnitrophota bacterium]
MTNGAFILLGSALAVAFIHTLLGPDHYLPFIVLSRARGWGRAKTAVVTIICGLGHVLSSALLGVVGIALGVGLSRLNAVEALRGDIAAWCLLAFGFTYFIWGLRRALRNKPHSHLHSHYRGYSFKHYHPHRHYREHSHPHGVSQNSSLTPWILFTIFVFGPCEPLIPLVFYAAARWGLVFALTLTAIFSLATIFTMLVMVFVLSGQLSRLSAPRMARYSHAAAGLAIFACGAAIKFLGM